MGMRGEYAIGYILIVWYLKLIISIQRHIPPHAHLLQDSYSKWVCRWEYVTGYDTEYVTEYVTSM